MSIYIEEKLATELGEVEIAITSADHVSIRGTPVLRGVKYNAHLHLFNINGEWCYRPDVTHNIRRAYINGEANKNFDAKIAPTYAAKIEAAYKVAVVKFAQDTPVLFSQAELQRLEREVAGYQGKCDQLTKELSDYSIKLNQAKAKLKQLKSHEHATV